MDVDKVLKILKSDCIDDPEDLLEWLAADGILVLEEYQKMKATQHNEKLWRLVKLGAGERPHFEE